MKFSTYAIVLSTLAIFTPALCTPAPVAALPTPVPTYVVESAKLARREPSNPIQKRYFKGNPVCGDTVAGSNGYGPSIQNAWLSLTSQPAGNTYTAPAGTCISLGCSTQAWIGSGAVWFCNDTGAPITWPANGLGQAAEHIADTCDSNSYYKGVWTNTVGFQVFVGSC